MKRLAIAAAALLVSPLLAETVGKLHFQFPPSQYEWNVCIDSSAEIDEEEEEEFDVGTAIYLEDEIEESNVLFTHREGDALEIFIANDYTLVPDEEDLRNPPATITELVFDDEGEMQTPEEVIKESLADMGFLLQNHEFRMNILIDATDDVLFFGWGLYNAKGDLFHGLLKAFRTSEGYSVLQYLTTAPESEQNFRTWAPVLNQATRD